MSVEEEVCTPGERLALSADHDPGNGTYVKGAVICASLLGTKRTLPPAAEGQKPRVEVLRAAAQPVVPAVGDVVTARVVRINPRAASLDVLCVGANPVAQRYAGVIRVQDVRATEIDSVRIQDCFRPGDVVRAEVLSLGDARAYYLSTARNELGVVYAKSVAGAPMVPVSWQEMQCPKTEAVEARKVAKVAPAAATLA